MAALSSNLSQGLDETDTDSLIISRHVNANSEIYMFYLFIVLARIQVFHSF